MAPFDREGALKRAEKALRLGRVDTAIEEYQALVLAQPRDWNSANALGDLFVRAGQLDKGVEQYTRIADHLADEGFYPKAAALFKKIIKVKPLDEYAQIRSGDVAAKQGLLADAKAAYQAVGERRRKMGNIRGAAEMAVRLGMVDPEDFSARFTAAKAARDLGDTDTALREFRAVAEWFSKEARQDEARSAYRDLLELDPSDDVARAHVLAADIASGEFARALAWASSASELRQLATALEDAGQQAEALAVLGRVADMDAGDVDARVQPRARPSRQRRHGHGAPLSHDRGRRARPHAVDGRGGIRAAPGPPRRGPRGRGERPGRRHVAARGGHRHGLPARRTRRRPAPTRASKRWPMRPWPTATTRPPRPPCTSSSRACAATSWR